MGNKSSALIPFTRETLVQGIKQREFKNIAFLTGAGMSVAAGIPDFRTPGTGLYYKVQELKLPYPEALFSIDYFKQRPEAFYSLARAYIDTLNVKPVLAHHFIKMVNDQNQLLKSYTQNIDGLELDAGVPSEKLVEAHGHLRSCKCVACGSKGSIDELKKLIKAGKNPTCKCGGWIKPDLTFFGEDLPASFYMSMYKIKKCDLAIVMGTSLVVQPFANLINMVPKDVPMVLINRENPVDSGRDNFLFLDGDIEKNVGDLIKDLGWEDKLPPELKEKL